METKSIKISSEALNNSDETNEFLKQNAGADNDLETEIVEAQEDDQPILDEELRDTNIEITDDTIPQEKLSQIEK